MHLQQYRTLNFYAWEHRGRGLKVFPYPVQLEPPYVPFQHAFGSKSAQIVDDGFSSTWLSRLSSRRSTNHHPPEAIASAEELFQLEGTRYHPEGELCEFGIALPEGVEIKLEQAEQLLLMLSYAKHPVSFEIIGDGKTIDIQFTCRQSDQSQLISQLQAYVPEAVIQDHDNRLLYALDSSQGAMIDLSLQQEFMRPLAMDRRWAADPLTGIYGVLEQLKAGQLGMLQVLFQATHKPWSTSIMQSVTDGKGGAFFSDAPEMVKLAQEKIAHPLYSVVVRTYGQGQTFDESWLIAEQLTNSLIPAVRSQHNALVVSDSEDYSLDAQSFDVSMRISHRSGMLLNSRELVSLVHLPTAGVAAKKLSRLVQKTKSAPKEAEGHGYQLGENEHQGQTQTVSLSIERRLRHMHLIGATGTGKSNLLLNLLVQDMEQGQGLALLDPHGDLVESVLARVPPERVKDVILIDPADAEYPVGLNPLSARSEVEKIVLSSDLVAMFKRFATSWGDQMSSVLANALDAFLESDTGGTFLDLRRFLVEKSFRDEFLESVTDPNVAYYWYNEFPLLKSNSISPLLTRLNTFLRPKLIRYMMAQKQGIDIQAAMDSRKILLFKLAQGLIGEENSYILGTLIVAKIQQAAQARQLIAKHERAPFFLYIDEFQNFITPSIEGILSGARKYGLGLVLAHQDLKQLFNQHAELGSSVISNPGTRICFRLGDLDAKQLESGFSYFNQADLQSLQIGQAIVRVGSADQDFNLSTSLLTPVDEEIGQTRTDEVIEWSREQYSQPKAEVEALLEQMMPSRQSKAKPKEKAIPKADPIKEVEPPSKEPEPSLPISIPDRDAFTAAKEQFIQQEQERKEITQHRYLQTLVKQMGEGIGYQAIIEKPTPDGNGRVDVLLQKDKTTIAVEVSITTPPHKEVLNIQKCLNAKYSLILSCSPNAKHLQNIRELAKKEIRPKELKRVRFFSPEELTQYLNEQGAKSKSGEKRVKGYRVNVNYQAVDLGDSERKQDQISKVIVEAMRRKKKSQD